MLAVKSSWHFRGDAGCTVHDSLSLYNENLLKHFPPLPIVPAYIIIALLFTDNTITEVVWVEGRLNLRICKPFKVTF